MIANPDYELSGALQSALKAKAPYVGVPIPGHAPLIFKRTLLAASLKGVRVVNVDVLGGADENGDAGRYLVVDGVAGERFNGQVCVGRTRHHMKVRAIPRRHFRIPGYEPANVMSKWIEKERKGKAAPPAPTGKTAKYLKAIAKLEKQLDRLGSRPEIFNPALATTERVPDGWRKEWSRWREERELRAKIGAAAKAGRTSKELYAALRGAGLAEVRTFSQLNTAERRSLVGGSRYSRSQTGNGEGTYLDYAQPRNLWRFQPGLLHRRPEIWGEDFADSERWGAGRYKVVLEWIRDRTELESRIAGVRVMMEDAAAAAAGRG